MIPTIKIEKHDNGFAVKYFSSEGNEQKFMQTYGELELYLKSKLTSKPQDKKGA